MSETELSRQDMELISNVLWRARHSARQAGDDEGVRRADVAISLMRQATLRNAQMAAAADGAAAAGRASVDDYQREQREVHALRAIETEPPLSAIYAAAKRELRQPLPAAEARRRLPPKRATAKRATRRVKASVSPAMAKLTGPSIFDKDASARFLSAMGRKRDPLAGAKPPRPLIPTDIQEEIRANGALTSPELSGALLAYASTMPSKDASASKPANRYMRRVARAASACLVLMAGSLGAALAAAL